MKYNELLECYELDEGVKSFIKKAYNKFKSQIKKLSTFQTTLLYKIVPAAITAGLVAGPQLSALAYEIAEKMSIEIDPEEFIHMLHIAEHILEHGLHLIGADVNDDNKEIVK